MLLGVALVLAALDWVAVALRILALEYVCKPAAALAFLATAIALDPASERVAHLVLRRARAVRRRRRVPHVAA